MHEACRQGTEQMERHEYERAEVTLQRAMESPLFPKLAELDRFAAYHSRGIAALSRADPRALSFLRQATAFSYANWDTWYARVFAARLVHERVDAASSLITLARSWPAELPKVPPELVFAVAGDLRQEPGSDVRREFLQTLFDLHWKRAALEPSEMWRDLVLLYLERKDPAKAATIAIRVESPREIVSMIVDRRFDPVINAAPAQFDVRMAQEREIARLREAVRATPRSVWSRLELAHALHGAGRWKDVLDLLSGIVSQPDNFDDTKETIRWVHDQRSRSLRALGRWDDALQELSSGVQFAEHDHPNVSQAINIALFYCALDRPNEALRMVERVPPGNVNDYGRGLIERVRLLAGLELRDKGMTDDALAHLRGLKESQAETVQGALVIAGQLDEASALMVRRLSDPAKRNEALLSVQHFGPRAHTPRQAEWTTHWDALVARPEVQAAIAAVGRESTFEMLTED